MINIKIDKEKCLGCGTCAMLAPKTFKMDDENKSTVIDPQGDDAETIKMVADSCPMRAIIIE